MIGPRSQLRTLTVDVIPRLSALACLVGAYQLAITGFDRTWLAVTVATALIVAATASEWAERPAEPQTLPRPCADVLWRVLLPGWLLMTAAAGCKLGGWSPQVVATMWLVGAVWLLVGSWLASRERQVRPQSGSQRWAWVCGLGVVALAAGVRLWAIDTVPRYVHCDEGTTVMIGQSFFENPDRDWFGAIEAGSYTTMSLCYALVSWGAEIGGFELVAARLPDVILGIASVALVFDGLRRVSTVRLATVAALLLAVNHCHLHYSRIASSYIQTAFVVSLCFAIWSRLWIRPTFLNAVGLGIVMALGAQTYRASMAAIPLLVTCMALLALLNRQRRRALITPLAVVVISCATAAAPFGVALWQQSEEMFGRASYLNILSEHMLPTLKERVYRTDSTAEVVIQQARRALLGFHSGHDHQPQYQIHLPMADRYTAALMVPGVVLCLLALRQFLAINALVFTTGYLLLGLGMQWAPGFNRATGALPLGMMLAAIALVQCCGTFWGGGTRLTAWLRNLSIAGGVALCMAANFHIYFVEYPYARVYGDAASEAGWVARKYFGQYTIHLVNWPLPGQEGLRLIVGDLDIPWHYERNALSYVNNATVSNADLFVINGHDSAARDAALARFPEARLEEWRPHPRAGPSLFLVFVEQPRDVDGGGTSSR